MKLNCFQVLFCLFLGCARAADTRIVVEANQVTHRLSPYLTGACIEDVNHEIYGGLYSQMIFGESFQEPPPPSSIPGFAAYGGHWEPKDDILWAVGGDGPKLIAQQPDLGDAEVEVEVLFPEQKEGNAGLILKVTDAGRGADKFTGYEISLESNGHLVLGRHRQNWEPIRRLGCDVPLNHWNELSVRMTGDFLEVFVNGRSMTTFKDEEHPLRSGAVGLRTWQRAARFRNLQIKTGGDAKRLAFATPEPGPAAGVTGMWRPFSRGFAHGEFSLQTNNPFKGAQSQCLLFKDGVGEVGIENRSLNRWGMNFVGGRKYDGLLWARAAEDQTGHGTMVFVALESGDGTQTYAEQPLKINGRDWQRLGFKLTPNVSDPAGRFAIKLKEPGLVSLGYAFLEPGEWGRFKGLPVRKDVSDALVAQGLTVLRYGGSMINHPEYRWKKMIGPPAQRPPYRGTWYAQSSNGWGIFDFLNFCEAADFLGIPAVNMDESPQDLADFFEYVNGPRDSPWGRRRAADDHPRPYHLKYLELGNEEAINEAYWRKFKPLAEAIWSKDPQVILVVGDFEYSKAIEDPYNFPGAPSIKSLAAHKKILDLARQHDREVWFDVHIGTENPPAPNGVPGVRSFSEQLAKLSPGARYKVVVFEFNAGNHALKRALANACAINQLERLGERIAIACSANCLQPYRQNDNGWNQGLLFLSPSQVWPQPPYYVTQMMARNFLPLCLKAEVLGPGSPLDVTATKSDDGRTLDLQVVNMSHSENLASISVNGFVPTKRRLQVIELAGGWDDTNTPEKPDHVKPIEKDCLHDLAQASLIYTFPANSFSILRFR